MDRRVADSDLIAIVSLSSVTSAVETITEDGQTGYMGTLKFTFAVQELLKSPAGVTPTQVVSMVGSKQGYAERSDAQVIADRMASERDTQWDNRNSIIFVATHSLNYPATSSGDLYYMAYIDYTYGLGDGYSLASERNRLWLPEAQTGSDDGGGARSATQRRFLTAIPQRSPSTSARAANLPNDAETPSIPLSDLKATISRINAELSANTAEGYQYCVRLKYRRAQEQQIWASQGREYDRPQSFESEIGSGLAERTVVLYSTWNAVYDANGWESRSDFIGADAALFRVREKTETTRTETQELRLTNSYGAFKQRIEYQVWDDPLETVRPLPAGTYDLTWKFYRAGLILCDPSYVKNNTVAVTVTAPDGTLHEAFFDPVTDGSAVAADSSNGQLEPAGFTDANEASATLQRIEWAVDTIKVKVSPHTGLAGHRLDFIELDGAVSLSLQIDDATVDAANMTLSWSVTPQPWHDGDLFMLRIAEVVPEVALVNVPASITQGQSASVTVRATDLPSSNSYTVRLAANSFAIGFNNSCLYGSKTVVVPSGSASHSATIPLQGCDATSSTVTATLMQGTSTVATATAEVEVEASSNVTVTLSPREERHGTYTNMTAQWNDPSGCVGRYYVGIFNSQQTVVNNLGYHPAPATTSLSQNLGRSWDDIPNLDWFVKVRCHSQHFEDYTIVGQASLQSGLPSTP